MRIAIKSSIIIIHLLRILEIMVILKDAMHFWIKF